MQLTGTTRAPSDLARLATLGNLLEGLLTIELLQQVEQRNLRWSETTGDRRCKKLPTLLSKYLKKRGKKNAGSYSNMSLNQNVRPQPAPLQPYQFCLWDEIQVVFEERFIWQFLRPDLKIPWVPFYKMCPQPQCSSRFWKLMSGSMNLTVPQVPQSNFKWLWLCMSNFLAVFKGVVFHGLRRRPMSRTWSSLWTPWSATLHVQGRASPGPRPGTHHEANCCLSCPWSSGANIPSTLATFVKCLRVKTAHLGSIWVLCQLKNATGSICLA